VPISADFTNPGNALLRKMGWEGEGGLGRGGKGREEAVGVELADAFHGGRRVEGIGAGRGSGGGPAADFYSKDFLKRAQQERFNAVSRGPS
jgi:hypothetical protein